MTKCSSQNIIFVNARNCCPYQNGTSWETAFTDLQSALDVAATSGITTSIWIAAGNYIPTKIYSPNGVIGGASGLNTINLNTFNLPTNVKLIGGFNGTECKLDQRDIDKNKTILNGVGVCWHVVIAGNDVAKTGVNVVLDGLTITGGNAQGPVERVSFLGPFTYAHTYGGGIYAIFGSTIKLRHVTLIDNIAGGTGLNGGFGGGFYSNNCDVKIRQCLVKNNTANFEGGGVEINNTFETTPHFCEISETIFEKNMAYNFGGGLVVEGTIQNNQSSVAIKSCVFRSNSAQFGGAFAVDSIQVDILDSKFINNFSAIAGGALSTANIVNSFATILNPPARLTLFPTTVKNTTFCNNVTAGNLQYHDTILGGPAAGIDFPLGGGAIVCYLNGILNVDQCTFLNNEAQNGYGGAILNGRSAALNPLGAQTTVVSAQTTVNQSKFVNNRAFTGLGSSIASLPSTFVFTPPVITPISSIVLTVTNSKFKSSLCPCSSTESIIYINKSTASLCHNCFNDRNIINPIQTIDSVVTRC